MLGRNRGGTATQPGADSPQLGCTLSFKLRLQRIHFSEDDIPDQFIDHYILHDIMENPVMLDKRHVMDYGALTEWWTRAPECKSLNPVTRKSYTSLELLTSLKNEIELFVHAAEQEAELILIAIHNHNQRILHKQQRILDKKERCATKLEKVNQLRETLIKEIQEAAENPNPPPEHDQILRILLDKLEALTKKKLRYETPFCTQTYIKHLRESIQDLVAKQETRQLTEIETAKLTKRLAKLDQFSAKKLTPQSKKVIYRHHTTLFHAHDPTGLLVLNQGTDLSVSETMKKEDM